MNRSRQKTFLQERSEWFASEKGMYVEMHAEKLLHLMIANWKRRSQSMLVLNDGVLTVLETIFEAGFDVTAQCSTPESLQETQAIMGGCVQYMLASLDSLACDDNYYDFTVILCGMEFWENPEKILSEIERVTCQGVIFLFVNTLSLQAILSALFSRLGRSNNKNIFLTEKSFIPWVLRRKVNKIFPAKHQKFLSFLFGYPLIWQNAFLSKWINEATLPLPFGALCSIRIDFRDIGAGTPLPLRVSRALSSKKIIIPSSYVCNK